MLAWTVPGLLVSGSNLVSDFDRKMMRKTNAIDETNAIDGMNVNGAAQAC